MQEFGQPGWAGVVGPLLERAEGRVFAGAAPVAATPYVVGAAAAMVVAYSAGALANALGGGDQELP